MTAEITPVSVSIFAKVKHSITQLYGNLVKDKTLSRRLLFAAAVILVGLAIASIKFVEVSGADPVKTIVAASQAVIAPQPTGPAQSNAQFAQYPSWTQDFSTQKDGLLNTKYWNILIGPADNSNGEKQYYTNDPGNISVTGGALHLTATNTAQLGGYQFGSARIESKGKKAFLYGRIDVTAKLPKGTGTWPAVWMLSDNDTYANKTPASNPLHYRNGGEMDIIEAVGYLPDQNYSVAHTASDVALRNGSGAFGVVTVPNSATEYATYTLLWTPTQLTFMVNGTAYFTYSRPANSDYTTWPYDQPFYLVANLAIGGSWGGTKGVDASALPTSLDIRSIYYYSYVGPTA